jgi:hypothetical protein
MTPSIATLCSATGSRKDLRTMPMQLQPGRLALGISALVCAFLLLRVLETGVLIGLPPWVATAWTFALVLSLLAAPILIGNGLGLFSTELLASVGTDRAPTGRQWVAAYIAIIGSVLAVGFALNALAGINLARSVFFQLALVFLLASTGKPWWLYGTIRRTGWFALIRDERSLRAILWLLAVILMVLALVVPEEWSPELGPE